MFLIYYLIFPILFDFVDDRKNLAQLCRMSEIMR